MSVRWRHYVYVHIRRDTGRVFYVGKGTLRSNRKDNHHRARTSDRRNWRWRRIVAECGGFDVILIASCADDVAAHALEMSLISECGRDSLCNMTDGGEGTCGLEISDELRRKRRINAQGKRSQAWIDSIRKARRNGGNGGVVKLGDKLPKEWRANISKAVSGEQNVMYGRTGELHPNAIAVLDEQTGASYPSVTAAAEACEYSYSYLHAMLSGIKPNKTTMVLRCL